MLARLVLIAALAVPFLAAAQQGPPPKFDNTPRSIDEPPPSVEPPAAIGSGPKSIDTTPRSIDAQLVAQAIKDAAAAVLAHQLAEALAACERGLKIDPRNARLHYYKAAALRERGVQSWNAGDKGKDEKLKNDARADWTAVIAVADEALANLPVVTPGYIELHYRFVREKAEVQYLLAHTSGIGRTDAVAALDVAIEAAQDPRLPPAPAAALDPKRPRPAVAAKGSIYQRPELIKLKRAKADLLVDDATAAEAVQARALYAEVLAADPQDASAMVGMSTACIIALDWEANRSKLRQSADACLQEALAFRAKVPVTNPPSARMQLLIDALKQVVNSETPPPRPAASPTRRR